MTFLSILLISNVAAAKVSPHLVSQRAALADALTTVVEASDESVAREAFRRFEDRATAFALELDYAKSFPDRAAFDLDLRFVLEGAVRDARLGDRTPAARERLKTLVEDWPPPDPRLMDRFLRAKKLKLWGAWATGAAAAGGSVLAVALVPKEWQTLYLYVVPALVAAAGLEVFGQYSLRSITATSELNPAYARLECHDLLLDALASADCESSRR